MRSGYPTPQRRLAVHLRGNDGTTEAARAALGEAKVDVSSLDSPHDAVVVDITDLADQPIASGRRIRSARQAAGGVPLLVQVDAMQMSSSAVQTACADDIVVQSTVGYKPLISALRLQIHRQHVSEELSLRLRGMADLGLPWLPEATQTTARTPRPVLLATPGPSSLATVHALHTHLPDAGAVMRPGHALQALESGAADALILHPGRSRRAQAALLKLIRRHADLSATPVIVLERHLSARLATYWGDTGADATLGTDDAAALAPLLKRLSRARRAADQQQKLLSACTVSDHGDLAQLAGPRFFDQCLAHRLKASPSQFALAAVRLDQTTGPVAAECLAEAALYVRLAVRPHDMITRPAPNLFLVAMPETDKVHAVRAIKNVSAMIKDLKFGPRDNAQSFLAASHVAIGSDDDSPDALIAAAISGLPTVQEADLLLA